VRSERGGGGRTRCRWIGDEFGQVEIRYRDARARTHTCILYIYKRDDDDDDDDGTWTGLCCESGTKVSGRRNAVVSRVCVCVVYYRPPPPPMLFYVGPPPPPSPRVCAYVIYRRCTRDDALRLLLNARWKIWISYGHGERENVYRPDENPCCRAARENGKRRIPLKHDTAANGFVRDDDDDVSRGEKNDTTTPSARNRSNRVGARLCFMTRFNARVPFSGVIFIN